MDSVECSLAIRTKELSPRQREFVSAASALAKKVGFCRLIRMQITMNAISLCQGSISKSMFLVFAKSAPSFEQLLADYADIQLGSPNSPTRKIKQLEFSLRMTQGKLRKARIKHHDIPLGELEDIHGFTQTEQLEGIADQNQGAYQDIDLPQWWKFLLRHFKVAEHNLQSWQATGSGCGFRYQDPELRKIYALMSLTGKIFYNVLQQMFGFPSLTMAREYRKQLQIELGITFKVLSGKKDDIDYLMTCFKLKGSDRRCVLSIDATALKCNFGVRADGRLLGTVEPAILPVDEASVALENKEEFQRLHKQQSDKIAKAVFVVLLNPVGKDEHEFPIAVFPYHQGQVDTEMLERLKDLNKSVTDLGFDVIGNGFDGDPKFTCFATKICNALMEQALGDLTRPVQGVFKGMNKISEIVPFFDPNHQVKCDRYRRCLANPACVFFNMEPTLDPEQFVSVLGVSRATMSDSEVHKMDDTLPRMLFNVSNLLMTIQEGRIDMFIALYPSTVLLTAIMSNNITRQDRIELLLYGWSVMMLYYISMMKYKEECSDSQASSQTLKRNGSRPIALWHADHVRRYISSVTNIIAALLDRRSIHLGALGSHHNENYFGQIKRIGGYDESVECFMKATEKALLLRKLMNDFRLDMCPSSRISESGARICEEDVGEIRPIGYYLVMAKSLFELITPYDQAEVGSAIEAFRVANKLEEWKKADAALMMLPASVLKEHYDCAPKAKGVTLRKTRAVSTAGLHCKERFITANQVEGNK